MDNLLERDGVKMTPQDAAEYDKYKEEAAYYDRLQYVFKIKLNSCYGALTNLYFRFYDLRMGESTTGTGRMILRHQCAEVNRNLTGKYDVHGEGVIYGDTDSTYFRTFAENKAEAILVGDAVAAKVNGSFQKFMQDKFLCNPGFDDVIKAGREIISQRGIFVEKKRYILHVVDLEGKEVDKLKVMGLDTKKTSLPREIANVINAFIERVLKGEDWSTVAQSVVEYKEQLRKTKNIFDIGLPKGISSIEYLDDKVKIDELNRTKDRSKTHIAGHVAAALHYNYCLDKFGDKVSIRILDQSKIKVFYIVGEFEPITLVDGTVVQPKSIALPTDLEVVPQWFFDNFVVDIEAHVERLIDNPLENIIGALGLKSPTQQSVYFDSMFNF